MQNGEIFIVDYANGIMHLDPKISMVSPYITRANMESFKGCNDLVFTKDGTLYFTDQGLTGMHDPTGRMYQRNVDGRLECMIDTIPSPNGLVPNLGESLLYISVLYISVTRANQVWRHAVTQGRRHV